MGTENQRIKGIIFDLDETLAVIDTNWELMRTRIRDLFASYDVHLEFRPVLQHLEQAKEEITRRFDEDLALSLHTQALGIIEDVSLEGAKSAKPLEGALEILETSKTLGLKIGILSRNTRESVLLTIQKCNFEKYIDVTMGREDCEKVKPDALPVIEMANRLGVRLQEIILVGDHPYDVLAGKSAGVLTIAVTTGYPPKEDLEAVGPDYLFSNLFEVKSHLVSLITKNA